jgi:hypothetical protein
MQQSFQNDFVSDNCQKYQSRGDAGVKDYMLLATVRGHSCLGLEWRKTEGSIVDFTARSVHRLGNIKAIGQPFAKRVW